MLPRRQFLHLAAGTAALPVISRVAKAQAYPTRPITMVVGAAPGGPTDTIGRIITERMHSELGQTIVIENNGAAAGSIAHGRVARAAPDGYTLSLGHWGTHVVNGVVYTLPYDVQKDFEPVALISSSPYFIVGRRDLPANDLKGLITWLKANLGKATQGTSGAGSPAHIAGFLLQSILGNDVVAKLNAAVVAALGDPGVRARLAELGQEIFPREEQTPEALGAFQKAEIEKWWPIIKAANIRAE
jgi:tripartite-type tricarboxylate transporter receptor subunit TctC